MAANFAKLPETSADAADMSPRPSFRAVRSCSRGVDTNAIRAGAIVPRIAFEVIGRGSGAEALY